MDKLDQWLQGTVHADKVFDHARRSFVANMTGMSFEECLHRATVDATAAAVRSFMGSDEVVERVAKALAAFDGGDAWTMYEVESRAALSAAIGEPVRCAKDP
jgi:hypothetical protein